MYAEDLSFSDSFSLKLELYMWRCQWKDVVNKPQTVIDTLPHCTHLLSKIQELLRLFATLLITSAIPERKFSTLRR